jgi:hypothetical protein
MKRLIDEGFLMVAPETTIKVKRGGRWSGFKPVASRFNYIEYPRDLRITSSDLTRDYTFAETDTRWASSSEERWISRSQQPWPCNVKEIEQKFFEYQIREVVETRPYTAHPVWNSFIKRGPMKIPELEEIVEEAGKIEEADFETFEESLLYCDPNGRPGSAPLEDLPAQMFFQKLLSALHRLCGEREDEILFSNMTDVRFERQKMALRGILSVRDAKNARTFIHFIELVHCCLTAPEIPEGIALLVREHAADLREILHSRQIAPKLTKLLDDHASCHTG